MNISGTLKSYFGDRPENEMKMKKTSDGFSATFNYSIPKEYEVAEITYIENYCEENNQ